MSDPSIFCMAKGHKYKTIEKECNFCLSRIEFEMCLHCQRTKLVYIVQGMEVGRCIPVCPGCRNRVQSMDEVPKGESAWR